MRVDVSGSCDLDLREDSSEEYKRVRCVKVLHQADRLGSHCELRNDEQGLWQ